MNLANLGKAGLLVAQNRLMTAGHNVNNAATPGYSRQRVIAETAGATPTAAGWIGRGVQAVSVQRSYDDFLSRQLMDSQVRGAALQTYGDQISQINNLVADRTVGISPALQSFFDGIQAVATAPADVAARQELIGRANTLASQIRDASNFFSNQRENVNTQITTTVSQVNSTLDRIQDLNRQIMAAKASSPSQPPNDLLDQRDQLVSDLGQLIDVRVYEQDDRVNITVGNGQVVLGGDSVFHLQARPSDSDPSRVAVNYTIPDGAGGVQAIEMDDSLITGGKLGGLLSFRSDALDTAQNDLGRLAVGLATAVNAVHEQGFDLSRNPGAAFFDLGAPKVIANAGNASGTASPAVSFTDVAQLTSSDYQLRLNVDDTVVPPAYTYTVTRVPSGAAVAATVDDTSDPSTTTVTFEGVQLAFDTASLPTVSGDSTWVVQPTRDVAAGLAVAVTDPDKIAAAGGYDDDDDPATPDVAAGPANGDNALALAALQTQKLLGGGSMNLNEAYSQLVNAVAVKTQANTTAQKAQETLVQQNLAAQQAVAGVNLDEEYINLMQYQEQYRAAARLIDTASTLFDTLLSLRN